MTDAAGPQKIVVGIDGSASSIDALRWAVRQAQLTGSVVEAMMVWQYLGGVVPAGVQDFEVESRRALDGGQRAERLGWDLNPVPAGRNPRGLMNAALP